MTSPVPTMPNVLAPLAPLTGPNLGASATGTVTPSDTTVFKIPTLALWIGTGGDLQVLLGGKVVLLLGVPAGLLWIAVTMVYDTNTHASDITALN